MATLTTQIFGRVEDSKKDEEQLLKLFWNRAELKKELDTLRRESLHLAEKLTQQEALTLRVQERLGQLETQLADPALATRAVAYFHLRGVWNVCRNKLQTMSSELSRVQHDAQFRLHVAAFRRTLNESMAGVQRTLTEVSACGDALSEDIRALREQRAGCRGIWNFFRRRRLTAEITEKRVERRSITMRVGELTEEIQARSGQEPPEFEGIDIAARRSINLRIIAFAQELFVHFADHDIAVLSRDASIRALDDLNVGNRRDCRTVAMRVEKQLECLATETNMEQRVRARMQYLKSELHYRRDSDTVPIAGTLGHICILTQDGRPKSKLTVNILGDEYWDIFAALLT